MTDSPKMDWLHDWLVTDMTGDADGIAAFIAGLTGGAAPARRLGNLYAASITRDGLRLENLLEEEWAPVDIPATLALAALRAAADTTGP